MTALTGFVHQYDQPIGFSADLRCLKLTVSSSAVLPDVGVSAEKSHSACWFFLNDCKQSKLVAAGVLEGADYMPVAVTKCILAEREKILNR